MTDSRINLAKSKLWVELYRPNTIQEIILPKRIKDIFTSGNIIQNFLFKGHTGTGKSSLAKILTNTKNSLWINASINNSIDDIRSMVDNFCSLQSLDDDGIKYCVFDEAELLSTSAQGALRGLVEEYSDHVRFIFTCNDDSKLIDAIKSRLEEINFDFANKEESIEQTKNYVERVILIGKQNGMSFDRESIQYIFKTYYPDLRKIIGLMQGLYNSGILNVTLADVTKTITMKNEELFKFLCTKPSATIVYTMVSTFKGNELSVLKDISANFIPYISTNPEYTPKLGDLAIKIHRYGVDSKQSIDLFVTLLALCTEISMIL